MEYPSRRALFQGETVRAEPMVFLRPDGRLINLEMHAGPVHSDTGEIVAAVAVAMDVTERRLAEARQVRGARAQRCHHVDVDLQLFEDLPDCAQIVAMPESEELIASTLSDRQS